MKEDKKEEKYKLPIFPDRHLTAIDRLGNVIQLDFHNDELIPIKQETAEYLKDNYTEEEIKEFLTKK